MKILVLLLVYGFHFQQNKLCTSRKFPILDLTVTYQHFKLNYEMIWHDTNVFLRDLLGLCCL